jgi:hypothetical protein
MVAHSKCSGTRNLIGLKDHQSCPTAMIREAASMADFRTLSQVVKRTELGVGEAEISRRSAEESFASYHP